MLVNFIRYFFPALWVLFFLGGCAFFSQEQLEPAGTLKGQKVMGEKVGYVFALSEQSTENHRYLLTKSPYCAEQVEELTVFRDRRKNIGGAVATVAAPLALVFPRIGPALIMSALERSRDEKVKKTGTISTGKVTSCGPAEPAPSENLFIQSSEMKISQHLQTDAEGMLDLTPIIQASGDDLYLNLYIDNGDSVFFVTTIFIR